MKRIGIVLLTSMLAITAVAQPPARRKAAQEAAKSAAAGIPPVSERAQLEFPQQTSMPEDVVWRRDIYRSLDLTKDANAVLYYPQEPEGNRVNLFTYLFKLILRGQIDAYNYPIDGREDFSEANRIKGKELLDKYHILYETKDGRIRVNDSDLPSSEVLGYYIKESTYFDQRTATYHTQVTALCPVMKHSDDFGSDSGVDSDDDFGSSSGQGTISYPMFWVKYSDVSKHLANLQLMGSNLNNASSLSADDYFTMNRYEGTIYKTNNLQGKVLANYCKTDSALKKEEKRIEKQLSDFEKHIWGADSVNNAQQDSLNVTDKKNSRSRTGASTQQRTSSRTRRSNTENVSTKTKTSKPSSPGSPRVSVRRQRH